MSRGYQRSDRVIIIIVISSILFLHSFAQNLARSARPRTTE
jgi:hypothetical protein